MKGSDGHYDKELLEDFLGIFAKNPQDIFVDEITTVLASST